jgi:hypothetical protein
VILGVWWELRQENCGNDEGHHVAQVSQDQWPPAAGMVDEKDAEELGYECDDG